MKPTDGRFYIFFRPFVCNNDGEPAQILRRAPDVGAHIAWQRPVNSSQVRSGVELMLTQMNFELVPLLLVLRRLLLKSLRADSIIFCSMICIDG